MRTSREVDGAEMADFIGDFTPPPGRPVSPIVVGPVSTSLVTESLLAGCRDTLVRHGVPADSIDVAWVPGSFEIPLGGQQDGRQRRVMPPSSAWAA